MKGVKKVRIEVEFDRTVYRDHKIPRSLLVLRPTREGVAALGAFLASPGVDPPAAVRFDMTLEPPAGTRTLDQNALVWTLYEILANEENQGIPAGEPGTIDAELLYERDLIQHAPRIRLLVRASDYAATVAMLTRWPLEIHDREDGLIEILALVTSSRWDTRRMALWIDMLFNRLAQTDLGIGAAEDVKRYWQEWRLGLNRRRLILHDEPMSEEEYRAAQVVCEACGASLVSEGGVLAHISTRGSGATWGPEKCRPSDWLMLCVRCELAGPDAFHSIGVLSFAKKHKHLRHKIYMALKRVGEESEDGEEEGAGGAESNPAGRRDTGTTPTVRGTGGRDARDGGHAERGDRVGAGG